MKKAPHVIIKYGREPQSKIKILEPEDIRLHL